MKSVLLGAAFLLIPISTFAQRAKSPADAAVFIRIVGSVHAEIENFGVRRTVDLDRVEVGTGSGFVISPYGYVITSSKQVVQLEVLATEQRAALARALLAAWVKNVSR